MTNTPGEWHPETPDEEPEASGRRVAIIVAAVAVALIGIAAFAIWVWPGFAESDVDASPAPSPTVSASPSATATPGESPSTPAPTNTAPPATESPSAPEAGVDEAERDADALGRAISAHFVESEQPVSVTMEATEYLVNGAAAPNDRVPRTVGVELGAQQIFDAFDWCVSTFATTVPDQPVRYSTFGGLEPGTC